MNEPILKLEGIKKFFGGVQALKGVDFEVYKGKIHYLAGENGSGKSTLIKVISGVHQPNEGRIWIKGTEVKDLNPIDVLQAGVQVIYQDFAIFPNLTVAENISINKFLIEPGQIINWKESEKIAIEAMRKIGVEIAPDELVENLSVANKQIVAICRALINDVDVLILDEPTTALTAEEVKNLNRVIMKLKESGIAIIIVNHKMDEVFSLADDVTILRNGSSVASGKITDFNHESFIHHLIGRNLYEEKYRNNNIEDELFRVENLGSIGAFQNVSFKINKGDILGITGLLSSGRGQVAEALFGMIPITSGKIFVKGKEIIINKVSDSIDNKIGYVPEDRLTQGLFLNRNLTENTVAASLSDYYVKNRIDHKKTKESTEYWIERLDCKTSGPDALIKELSGGNAQKIAIAKWLNTNPNILILNGPTVGVDIGSKDEIHNILQELSNEGVAVIVVSDDLTELVFNCNKLLVMWEGEVAHEITNDNLDESVLTQLISVDPKESINYKESVQ